MQARRISGCIEEKEKAKKILAEPEWEEKIREAEETLFFKGSIRFLYTGKNGCADWSLFDQKLARAKELFDDDGVRNPWRENARLLRVFLAHEYSLNHINDKFWFGNGRVFWRNRALLALSCQQTVDYLLTADFEASPIPTNAPDWIRDESLLSEAIGKDGDRNGEWHVVTGWKVSGDLTLTRYNRKEKGNVSAPHQIIPLAGFPADKLSKARHICLAGLRSPQRRGKNCFIGWKSDIDFQYKDRWFRWYGTPTPDDEFYIYLLKNDWESQSDPYEHHRENPAEQGDKQTYYCFMVAPQDTKETFRAQLDDLICMFTDNQGLISP